MGQTGLYHKKWGLVSITANVWVVCNMVKMSSRVGKRSLSSYTWRQREKHKVSSSTLVQNCTLHWLILRDQQAHCPLSGFSISLIAPSRWPSASTSPPLPSSLPPPCYISSSKEKAFFPLWPSKEISETFFFFRNQHPMIDYSLPIPLLGIYPGGGRGRWGETWFKNIHASQCSHRTIHNSQDMDVT